MKKLSAYINESLQINENKTVDTAVKYYNDVYDLYNKNKDDKKALIKGLQDINKKHKLPAIPKDVAKSFEADDFNVDQWLFDGDGIGYLLSDIDKSIDPEEYDEDMVDDIKSKVNKNIKWW